MSRHPLRDCPFVDEVVLLQHGWTCDQDGLLWWKGGDSAGAVTFTEALAVERQKMESED